MSLLKRTRPRRTRTLSAIALLLLLSMMLGLVACTMPTLPTGESTVDTTESVTVSAELTAISIENGNAITLSVGETLQLRTSAGEAYDHLLTWSSTSDAVTVSSLGFVSAKRPGASMVTVQYGKLSAMTIITVVEPETDLESESAVTTTPADPETQPTTPPVTETQPTTPPDTEAPKPRPTIPEAAGSPAGYKPAASYEEALERTARGELSGYLWLMDQEPNIDPHRPMQDGKYIRNNVAYFADENTYVVVDSAGEEVFRVYRGGGYITLEEVAAYLYAFGDVPANYTTKKVTNVGTSIWGEYLRGNHSKFSGNTTKYPYEPKLPRISGCGGDLQYYEIDIGTTGTDCDPGYAVRPYNDGYKITRGAARIVYARFDANGNKVIDADEKFIFYTYNHYNDFREYLNYYGGWGEMFGNITGGGELSSKYNYNPTPYVPVVLAPIGRTRTARILCADLRRFERAA